MIPIVTQLLRWYRKYGRDLPWRNIERLPFPLRTYRILVSEFMLQQTQVSRVIPKYREWLRRFPSWKALAQAPTADLIHAWAGLGYNRRALALREIARYVIERGLPANENEWRQLKGIGPYTAAAVTEFALHKRAVVIDTNVRRVAGRIFTGQPYPSLAIDPSLQPILGDITPKRGKHWEIPQAFMDLGSMICTSSTPACRQCPLNKSCKAAPLFHSGKAGKKPFVSNGERKHRDKRYPDRIYRGRILKLLRTEKAQKISALGPKIDETFEAEKDLDWLRAMVARLIKDNLVAMTKKEGLSLPNT